MNTRASIEICNRERQRAVDRDLSPLEPLIAHERRRAALPDEAQKIEPHEILLIPKLSRFTLDQQELGLGPSAIEKWYRSQGLDAQRIIIGHERQQLALQVAREQLPADSVVFRDEISATQLENRKLVIALGGDNHFCYVAGLLKHTFIAGVNSDPTQSEGAMTYFDASELNKLIQAVRTGNFLIEDWTRLGVSVGGRDVGLALNDVFLGEAERHFMSRHLIKLGSLEEEQKGSGLLVVTGSDSYGWYRSASRYLHKDGDPFSKTSVEARFLLTEPYCGTLNCASHTEGRMLAGDILEVTSLNDSRGVVMLDSMTAVPFPRGAVAQVRTAPHPLRVATLS